MNKHYRNKLAGILFGCLGTGMLFFVITGTSAYMTDHQKIINRISAGYNDTGTEEEFPDPDPIIPGGSTVKKVCVRNRGPVECYVRVSVLVSEGTVVLEGLDMKNWVREDDFYYYRNALEPGECTTDLFTGVKTEETADGNSITVTVTEESIQTCYAGIPYRNYREAWNHYRGGEMI